MSSPPFEVIVEPDTRLQRSVARLGAVAVVVGVVLVVTLPLPWALRGVLAAAWVAIESAAIRAFLRAAGRWRVLEFSADGARALFDDGIWRALEARAGALVTERLAWLRFVATDGRAVAALVTARGLGARDWRRLRLWYRLSG